MSRSSFARLLEDIRACTVCAAQLPHDPRPVVRLDPAARVLVIGQAPGSKVHRSGDPWADDSGDRLVDWLGVRRDQFDDPRLFAILPMGFCYPGKGRSGDLPPRPECAPLWHQRVLDHLVHLELTLLVGRWAQRAYLDQPRSRSLTATVRDFRRFLPDRLPLPHPAWRSRLWMRQNPWFEAEVLPVLQTRVRQIVAPPAPPTETGI